MHHRPPRRWHPRFTPAAPGANRLPAADTRTPAVPHTPDPLTPLRAETPGPDGIRHALVARVRQLIAAGEYDTPDRWAAAEERLLARVESDR